MNDFECPRLRKCTYSLNNIKLLKRLGGGLDGYCWLVKFGEDGPFVLKVFWDRKGSHKYPLTPQAECRVAALLQMMEHSVLEGKNTNAPVLLNPTPKNWYDAFDNTHSFAVEVRQNGEAEIKRAAELGFKLEPILSVPRLRKCYGWLKVGSKFLEALPSSLFAYEVRVDYKTRRSFDYEPDEDGKEKEYRAIVYEYIESGPNDPEVVQATTDFYHLAGFSVTPSPCAKNWENSILLDFSEIIAVHERSWLRTSYMDGMKSSNMLHV